MYIFKKKTIKKKKQMSRGIKMAKTGEKKMLRKPHNTLLISNPFCVGISVSVYLVRL